MKLSSLHTGDIVLLTLQDTSKTIAQVWAINHEERKVELRLKGQDDHIVLDWSIPHMEDHISDVPISEELLTKLGYICDKGWLYSLPDEEFWQKNLTWNSFTFYEILKKEQGEWVSVESKPDAVFGCKFISIGFVRIYQRYFERKYGMPFPQFILDRLFE